MSEKRENAYKACRESAGLTQDAAAGLLAVAVRTLSDYENGHARVPDGMVVAMAEGYKSPLLVHWHLKHCTPFGRFLPDIQEPATNGDMAFQAIVARDDYAPAVESMQRIVADGVIDGGEAEEFRRCVGEMRRANGRIASVVAYAEGLGAARGEGA
jgi:transcriptional regulator with XRE-family HTH domain